MAGPLAGVRVLELTRVGPGGFRSFAPSIGADTQVVLERLGYDAEAIAELRRKGVV